MENLNSREKPGYNATKMAVSQNAVKCRLKTRCWPKNCFLRH